MSNVQQHLMKTLFLLALLVDECNAAGGVSIFKLGTRIDAKAWTVMGMYFAVFLITIVLELTVHYMHHAVSSSSGQAIVHHVTTEVMILGGISAVLVVFENMGGGALIDAALFHYVHFVIFLMAIIFITTVSSLFIFVEKSWARWVRFENGLQAIETDPTLPPACKSAFMLKYVKSTSSGERMTSAIIYFKASLPEKIRDVSFSRYMMKQQRRFMIHFLDLHVSSWSLLGLLCLASAVVTGVVNEISDNPLAVIAMWVLIVGFGCLLLIIVLYFKIRKEFADFALMVQAVQIHGEAPRRQSKHFWISPQVMTKIMQTVFLYQVFFLATAISNFMYRLAQEGGGEGISLMVLCIIPYLLIFYVIVPRLLPDFTVLASLGEYLDHDTCFFIMQADKASGKYRRHWNREAQMRRPSKFLGASSGVLIAKEKQPPYPRLSEEEEESTLCLECAITTAAVLCQDCGYLCAECDNDYHRLKKCHTHTREFIGQAAVDIIANEQGEKPKSTFQRLLELRENKERIRLGIAKAEDVDIPEVLVPKKEEEPEEDTPKKRNRSEERRKRKERHRRKKMAASSDETTEMTSLVGSESRD